MHHGLDYDWILCWFLQTKVVPGGCQSTTRSPVMVNWASTKRSLTAWTSIYQVILHTVKCHVNTLKKFQQVFLMHVITLSKWVLKTSIFKYKIVPKYANITRMQLASSWEMFGILSEYVLTFSALRMHGKSATFRQHYYPEGGWGWVITFCCFLVNIFTTGLQLSFSVLYLEIIRLCGRDKISVGK